MMKILLACEYSGRTREAFRRLGHDVTSCDLLPSEDNSPHHIVGDVLELLGRGWDMMVAHPPCTYLTNSGVCHLYKDRKLENGINETRWDLMEQAAEFFSKLLNANIPKIAIENPIMHGYGLSRVGVRATQVIQPWMFGHPEQKATCLWLKGLQPLVPTNNVKKEMLLLPKKDRQRLHYLSPGPDRWKERSRTFQGISDAMAEQWG